MPKARHRHCYAPGCPISNASITEERNLSVYCVPKDEVPKEVWEKNLHHSDKTHDEKCAVGELHFEGTLWMERVRGSRAECLN